MTEVYQKIIRDIENYKEGYRLTGIKAPPYRILLNEYHLLRASMMPGIIPKQEMENPEFCGVKLAVVDRVDYLKRNVLTDTMQDLYYIHKTIIERLKTLSEM